MGAIQNSINQALGTAAGAAYGVKRTIAEEAQTKELKATREEAAARAELAKQEAAEREEFTNKANITYSSNDLEKRAIQDEMDKLTSSEINEVISKNEVLGNKKSIDEIAYDIAMKRAKKSRLTDPVRKLQYDYARGKIKNFNDYVEALNKSYIKEAKKGFKPGDFEFDLARALENDKEK